MAIILAEFEKNIKRLIDAINQLVAGRSNATGKFTLTDSTTTTVVSAPNCSKDCEVFLRPLTADARAEFVAGDAYVSAVSQGSFTVTHLSNTNDRQFGYLAIGG